MSTLTAGYGLENVGPDGIVFGFRPDEQAPLQEKAGISGGIVHNLAALIGIGSQTKTITVSTPGTLFLGINDYYVGDNSGPGFTVTVPGS